MQCRFRDLDRGCLPAIASPPGIARLQPRRTGRSGEAGGESRSHRFSIGHGAWGMGKRRVRMESGK